MNELNAKLLETASSTFEDLGFLFAESVLETEQAEATLDVVGSVAFTGPQTGSVLVQMSRSSADAITANMLGQDTAPAEADMLDGLGEVVNVICGNILPSVFGAEAVFDLHAPSVTLSSAQAPPRRDPTAEVVLGLDDGRAQVALFVEE